MCATRFRSSLEIRVYWYQLIVESAGYKSDHLHIKWCFGKKIISAGKLQKFSGHGDGQQLILRHMRCQKKKISGFRMGFLSKKFGRNSSNKDGSERKAFKVRFLGKIGPMHEVEVWLCLADFCKMLALTTLKP